MLLLLLLLCQLVLPGLMLLERNLLLLQLLLLLCVRCRRTRTAPSILAAVRRWVGLRTLVVVDRAGLTNCGGASSRLLRLGGGVLLVWSQLLLLILRRLVLSRRPHTAPCSVLHGGLMRLLLLLMRR